MSKSKSNAATAAVAASKKAGPVIDPAIQSRAEAGLRELQKADGFANAALRCVFEACASGAQVTAEMLAEFWPASGEASRGVYVSEFMTAGKVAGIIGEKAALQLIADAVALPGRVRVNVMAALRAVRTVAKEAGATVATKAQAAKFSKVAVKAAKDNGAAVKVKAKEADARKPRTPAAAGPGPATPADTRGLQAVMGPKSLLPALQLLIGQARDIGKTIDPAHKSVWDAAVKGLSTSFEGFAMCAK